MVVLCGILFFHGLLQAIVEDGMLDNAKARGQQLMQGLVRLSSSYPITDIRGRGLMVGLEFGGKDGSRNAEKGVVGVSGDERAVGSLVGPAGV